MSQTKRPGPMKWHSVNSTAAHALTTLTNSPGIVYPLTTSDLPAPLQRLPGVSSYYVTAYSAAQPLPYGQTVRGELLVARADGALTKNYQFAFATSSSGEVYFCGPFKKFKEHVWSAGQPVTVESLFNHTPFSPGGRRP